jgi:preprotein translocase subunit SecY
VASASEQFVANLNFASLVKAKELHQRVLFTLCALVVYRLGTFIPIMMDERRPVLITDEPTALFLSH